MTQQLTKATAKLGQIITIHLMDGSSATGTLRTWGSRGVTISTTDSRGVGHQMTYFNTTIKSVTAA